MAPEAVDADPNVQRAVVAVAAARAAANAAPPVPTQANITDADSRIMKTATGWVQGYNAQAAVNEACDEDRCSILNSGRRQALSYDLRTRRV